MFMLILMQSQVTENKQLKEYSFSFSSLKKTVAFLL